MHGHIKVEAIGKHGITLAQRALGLSIPNRFWMAEIIGLSETYGFERSFIKPKYDYLKSNSKGSRGVYANYFPEYGKIYEVSEPLSWKKTERYFCKFDQDGEYRMDKNEVVECLKKNH